MTTVEIRSVTKDFGAGVRAIDSLDLSVRDGEFFALLGPSGCGKTTLLRSIAGLENPTSGSIHIGERDVTDLPPGARRVAMVFQDYALYPHMTVLDNVSYPLKVRKVGKEDRRARATEASGNLSLAELLDRRPGQLSGGQQQRVALARAVASEADLFLFDEPLSNLDARLRLEARGFLKALQRDLGITTIYVTHDQSEALALADRMAVMQDGQIRQIGEPADFFHRPANLFVAGFIGSTPMNLAAGRVVGDAVEFDGGPRLPLPDDARPVASEGQPMVYGVRPEYVGIVSPGRGHLQGEVRVLENLGTHHLVAVEVEGQTWRATVREGDEPAPGDAVGLQVEFARSLVYDRETEDLVGDVQQMTA